MNVKNILLTNKNFMKLLTVFLEIKQSTFMYTPAKSNGKTN
jgi:hypothetical protein